MPFSFNFELQQFLGFIEALLWGSVFEPLSWPGVELLCNRVAVSLGERPPSTHREPPSSLHLLDSPPSAIAWHATCSGVGSLFATAEDSSVDPGVLIERAKGRCCHRQNLSGFCSFCFQWVMAQTLVEENPELCMDDAINVVSEWMLRVGRDVH